MSKRTSSVISDGQSFSNDDYNSAESSPNQTGDFNGGAQLISGQRKRYRHFSGSNDQLRGSNKEPSEEELRKKENRRQRNKIAAAKCRQKRIDQLKSLGEEVEYLKIKNKAVEAANLKLFEEFEKLERILRDHRCHMSDGDRKALEAIFSNPDFKKLADELRSGTNKKSESLSEQLQKTVTENSTTDKQDQQNAMNSNISLHNITENGEHSKNSNHNNNISLSAKRENVSSNSCNSEQTYNSSKESQYDRDFKAISIESSRTKNGQIPCHTTIIDSYDKNGVKGENNQNHHGSKIATRQSSTTLETPEKKYIQSLPRPSFFPEKFSTTSVELPKDTVRDDTNPFFDNNFQSDEKVNLFTLGNDVTGLTPIANNIQYPTLLDTPTPMGDKEFQIL
uniref:BZIP domain-containing protein n=1 Tax=Strongyloides venezuelensis TaxID=75913 RepID=A0A0K0FYL7_STRVS